MRRTTFWAALLVVTAASGPSAASEAANLLPAESDVLLTVNVRQILADHQKSEAVKRFLEPWRLALRGDDKQLRQYHRDHDLLRAAGIGEQDFLMRAKLVKLACDSIGLDPLQDVHRISSAFNLSEGFLAIVVEGRFDEAKVRTTLQRLAKDLFGSAKATRVGAVEVVQLPDGVNVALLNSRTPSSLIP